MKTAFLTLLIIYTAFVSAEADGSCESQDVDVLECFAVKAPLVTELREGFVEIAFTVQPDGSVSDVRVIDSGGDKRWIDAAVKSIYRWRYRVSNHSVEKTQRFDFVFDG